MRFDNRLFEQGVSQSLKTIAKLKEALNFPGVSKGLETVTTSASKIQNSFGDALNSVKDKFGALEIAAGVALGNIVTSALNAGTRLIKSFTLDPITDGLREYETQMNAVQTILANTQSKGSTLDDVNKALDELNTYADKTIYNFTEMTRNIGTFTAAGVDLDKSVASIKGIANLAAVSGSTSQQASTAMYQLSQAIATGTVKLQDWNSVVNAGMGGEVFQTALKRTARVMGTGVDAAIEKYGTFRESLTEGAWLTTDVLTETLKQISGAYSEADLIAQGYSQQQAAEIVQLANTATSAATEIKTFTGLIDTAKESLGSGWATTWKLIIGDFEEAKSLWTGVGNVVTGFIDKMSDARNAILKTWKDMGGRSDLLEGFKNIFTGLYNLIYPFAKAIGSIIPKVTGEKLFALTKGFKELTEFFKVSEKTSKNLANVLTFLATPLRILVDVVGKVIGVMVKLTTIALKPVITLAQSIAVTLINMSSAIVNFIYAIGDAIKNSTVVTKTLEGINKYIKPIIDTIVNFLSNGYNKIVDKLYGIRNIGKDNIMSFLGVIKTQLEPLAVIGDFLKTNIEKLMLVLTPIATELKDRFITLGTTIKDGIKNFDYGKIGEYTSAFKMKFEEFINYLKDAASILKERSVFDIVGDYLNDKFGPSIEKVSSHVSKGIGILKGAFISVKDVGVEKFSYLVDRFKEASDKLSNIGTYINKGIQSLVNGLKTARDNIKSSSEGFKEAIQTVGETVDPDKFMQFIGGGALIGIIWKLKSVFDNFMDLIKGKQLNNSIIDVMDSLSGTLEAYQKNLKADRLIKIAGAIAILAGALLLIGQIDSDKLLPSVGALGAVMAELAGLMKAFEMINMTSGIGSTAKTVLALIGMSTGLLILSGVFVKMANLKWDTIAKGCVSIAAMAGILVVSANTISANGSQLKKAAWGMITFSTALKLMVKVVEQLGSLDLDVLAKGLTSVGILCAELALFLKVSNLDGMGVLKGTGLLLLATSLLVLSQAVKAFGNIDFMPLVKGLASIAALMFILRSIPGLTSTAVGMSILSVALMGLSVAIRMFDALKPDQIVKGLLTIGAAISAIALAMQLIPQSAISKALGMSMVMLSLGKVAKAIEKIGNLNFGVIVKGVLGLAGALTAIGIATTMMTGSIGGAVAMTIMTVSLGLLANVLERFGSMELSTIGVGLLALAGVLGVLGLAGLVLTPVVPILLGLSGALALLGVASLALGAGLLLASTGLTALAVSGAAGFTALVAGIKGVIDLIPYLVIKIGEAFIAMLQFINQNMPLITEVVISAVKGMITAIIALTPMIVGGIITIITILLETLAEHLPDFIDAGSKMVVALLDGITNNLPSIIDSATNLITKFIDGIANNLPSIVDSAINLMTKFINAIAERAPDLVDAGLNLMFSFATSLMEGLAKRLPDLITGIKDVFGQLMEAGKTAITNAITEFVELGADIVSGIVKGITGGLSSVANAIGDLASSAIRKAKDVFDINSPSKEFEKMGMYNDMGLAKGITKYGRLVTKSTKEMGTDTLDTMRSILSKINFDDLDDDPPKITPILDMSLINKGAEAMNSLFRNQELSVGIAGVGGVSLNNIDAIKNSNPTLQNDNSDVVSAINDLKKSLGDINNGGNSYRIGDITYDDGSNVSSAVESLVRAAKMKRRT